MEKSGELRRGGSNRLSTPILPTGRDSNGVLYKKEKLRRLSEMDHSITTSKRVKLPKKFSNDCGRINDASVPRKLRSAMKKREPEPLKACKTAIPPVLPHSSNEIVRFELPSRDCPNMEEHKDLKKFVVDEITKEEEEVVEALFALAQTYPNPEPSCLLVLRETENSNEVNESQKRCSVHVHICRLIKVLQSAESKDPNPQKTLNETENTHEKTKINEDRSQWSMQNMSKEQLQTRLVSCR